MADSSLSAPLPQDDVAAIDELRHVYARLCAELGKIIVGQQKVVEQLAICLFARGHGLLMGVPGLAKTLLISAGWRRRCRSASAASSSRRI